MYKFEEGEQVIKVIRRHYLVMVPMVVVVLILAVAPSILYTLIFSDYMPFGSDAKDAIFNFVSEWKMFGYSVWLLLLWIMFFVEWTNYYLDMWVITNKRILDVNQLSFFNREVTSFRYQQIQNITIETRGFIRTMFKFGNLHIETAGHGVEILIRDAHYPEEARSLILGLQEQARSKQHL